MIKKRHKFFCPCWAGGGRTLICLSTVQLVEPFAGFLVWAVIFLVVLNLIFIVLILQACFSTCLPSVSANRDRPLFFVSVRSLLLRLRSLWRITSDVFAQSTSGLEVWNFHQPLQNPSQCFVQSAPALKAELSTGKLPPLMRPTWNRD